MANKKQKKTRNKGIITGLVVSSLISSSIPKIYSNKIAMPAIKKISNLDPEELKLTQSSFLDAFNKSILKEKKVELFRVTGNSDNHKVFAAVVGENSSYSKFLNKIFNLFPKNIANTARDAFEGVVASIFKDGNNAAFAPATNKMLIPDKLSFAAFHEMGHALNKNVSKIGNLLQKSRNMQLLAAPILLIAILNKTKVEDTKHNENQTVLQKTTGFIKRNAGKLAFLSFAPMLIEEFMASAKGGKIAKEALKDAPNLLKKVNKTNILGFSTYFALAALTGLGTMVAVKVKDHMQTKHEDKQAKKMLEKSQGF